MKPLVSIIVPVYNVENYLNRCINSLTNQTLKNIEIILVNDGSTDRSPEICDMFSRNDNRIKVIHKHNKGLGLARNSGLEVAQGKYIAFVDSDDFVDENMYKDLYYFAIENNLDTVISGFKRYLNNGTELEFLEVDKIEYYNTREKIKKLCLDMIGSLPEYEKDYKLEMSVWRGIYSREVIKENSICFPSEREFISEDLIYHINYFQCCKNVAIIPKSYYYYCLNNNSLTTTYRKDRYIKNKILYLKVVSLLEKYGYDKTSNIYAERLFLSRVRVATIQIVNNIHKLGYKNASLEIKNIAEDTIFKELLETYPLSKLPIKQKIFFVLYRIKSFILIILIIKINNINILNRNRIIKSGV